MNFKNKEVQKNLIKCFIVLFVLIAGFGIYKFTYGDPYWVAKQKSEDRIKTIMTQANYNNTKTENDTSISSGGTQAITSGSVSDQTSNQEHVYTTNEKMDAFTSWIKTSLVGLCQNAYFNTEKDLIIIVNEEWYRISKEEQKDIMYVIKDKLGQSKSSLSVSGYVVINSISGRKIDSFYVN